MLITGSSTLLVDCRRSTSLAQVVDVIFRITPRYVTPWQVSLIVHRRADRRVDLDARAAGARRRGGDVSAPGRPRRSSPPTHVSKWYGQVIGLNDVTVNVPPGITGLLGPNGAGKSTFMKLITGQLKPSKGVGDGARRADLAQSEALLPDRVLPGAGRVLRADDRPRVGDGARAPQRPRREGGRRGRAPRA